MIEELKEKSEKKMTLALDRLKEKFKKIRTGRAHVSMLDGLMVSYYGSQSELSHIASISCPDARTLLISPWDQNILKNIEEALIKSSLGMAPQNDGKAIRLIVPELTEDRRQDIIRSLKKDVEKSRVEMRQVRKEAKDQARAKLKEKLISEDENRSIEDEIQKQTDRYIEKVNEMSRQKEKELTQV